MACSCHLAGMHKSLYMHRMSIAFAYSMSGMVNLLSLKNGADKNVMPHNYMLLNNMLKSHYRYSPPSKGEDDAKFTKR